MITKVKYVYIAYINIQLSMSQSITKLLSELNKASANVASGESELHNPDIPTPNTDFPDNLNIKDQWMNARRLTNQPRNGGQFALPRQAMAEDPRLDAFMMDGSIDPNNIRKRTDPDSALPTLAGGKYALYSTEPSTLTGHDSMGLIQSARKSYVNYRDRFNVTETPKSQLESRGKIRMIPSHIPTQHQNDPIIKQTAIPTTGVINPHNEIKGDMNVANIADGAIGGQNVFFG